MEAKKPDEKLLRVYNSCRVYRSNAKFYHVGAASRFKCLFSGRGRLTPDTAYRLCAHLTYASLYPRRKMPPAFNALPYLTVRLRDATGWFWLGGGEVFQEEEGRWARAEEIHVVVTVPEFS